MKFFEAKRGRAKQAGNCLTSFQIDHFGISEIGLVRSNNEDVWSALPDKQFYVLADGMGGHQAGEVASSFAVETMNRCMHSLPDHSDVETACRLLRDAIAAANTKVYEEAHRNADYAGMGTTLSCFLLIEKFLIYGHVGDSRLYRYRNRLQQLTEDHSLRQTLCNREEEKKSSPLLIRNVITRAIGTHPTILPDIGVIPLRSKDIYMLCSDGLSDYADEQTIGRILASPLSLEEMGRNLVESALEKGGNDNITLLLVRISDEKNLSR